MIDLRPYQLRAIDGARAAIRAGKRAVLLQSPTGSGKTTIGAQIAHGRIERGGKVAWYAHRRELISQAADRLRLFGLDVAIHGDRPSAPVQVTSVQTALSRREIPHADLVILDEAHHYVADEWAVVPKTYRESNALILGLTATPERADGTGLGEIFDELVVVAQLKELTDLGFLVPCEVLAPNGRVQKLAADPWEAYLKHAPGSSAVVFAYRVQHAEDFADGFRKNGVDAEVVHGELPKDERDSILARLADGSLPVVVNVNVLTEGWDCLDSETEILTSRGWRGMGAVNGGDEVYSLNTSTGRGEFVHVLEYGEREMRDGERMVSIESQHANIRVTEGHRFWLKYRDPKRNGALSASWITKTGAELVGRRSAYALPVAAEPSAHFPGLPLSDDDLRFVAWFMTDGGFVDRYVAISQTVHKHADRIRSLLTRLGFDFLERTRDPGAGSYPNAQPCVEFRVPKGTGSNVRRGWFERFAEYLDKNVSPSLHAMTPAQFLVLWEEMLLGDGERGANRSGWLWCDRRSQVDAWEWMAVARGFSVSHSERVTAHGRTVYRVSVRSSRWLTSDPGDDRAARVSFNAPLAGERVWCVRNKNETLFTRRRGKVAVIGNCPRVSTCILARNIGSPSLYLQCVGRILRPAEGKTSALLIDLARNVAMHGPPDEDRIFSLVGAAVTREGAVAPGGVALCRACGFELVGGACPECGREQDPTPEGEGVSLERMRRDAWAAALPTDRRTQCLTKWLIECAQRGHKEGAAMFKYKAVFKRWPEAVVKLAAMQALREWQRRAS